MHKIKKNTRPSVAVSKATKFLLQYDFNKTLILRCMQMCRSCSIKFQSADIRRSESKKGLCSIIRLQVFVCFRQSVSEYKD